MVEANITSIEPIALQTDLRFTVLKTSHGKDVWLFPYKMQQSATTKGRVGDFGKDSDSKLALKAWDPTLPGVGGGLNAMLSDYLMSHSPVRKHYTIKSASYYNNSGFHSRWNALMTYHVCTNRVCSGIQIHIWQAGRTEHFAWTNMLWSYSFHRRYKYI